MLGATLVKSLSKKFDVYGTGGSEYSQVECPYMKFDLSNKNYEELINWSKPDVIIHSGAITNGNYCNKYPLEAFNINGVSLNKLIDATTENVKLIYISTDAVFPSKLHMAKEVDAVCPENVYGKSKELGEFFLRSSNRKYSIVRTTIVGLNENKNKSGFVEWIINSAQKKSPIDLFSDVLFNPISIWDLSKELLYLIENDKLSCETLHITGTSACTKYDFGIALLKELGISNLNIREGSINKLADRAKRCNDQTMDNSFYEMKYGRVLPDLKKTILTIKKNYHE